MMARTSYHRHQILASIALATAVIAFIFLVVDSGTSDNSGLLLSLRGIENTIQYDADGRQLQAASAVIDPKTIEVVNRSPDFIAQVQELATTVLPEQYQPQQKQYDPKYIYSIKCTIVDNLPTGWCMDEATQTPRYLGSSHQNNHSLATTAAAAAAIGTTYEILHYTHAGYDKCLSNKNILFIGESRTRYQYVHLLHYLKNERFMKCQDRKEDKDKVEADIDEDCYVINEKMAPPHDGTFGKWNSWFKNSTALLQQQQPQRLPQDGTTTTTASSSSSGSTNTQDSLCDCYRPPDATTPRSNHRWYDNRYTKRVTPHGTTNLIYLGNNRDFMSVNQDYPPYSNFYLDNIEDGGDGDNSREGKEEKRCRPGECGRAYQGDGVNVNAFTGSMMDTVETVLPLLNVTHAFINPGWSFDHDPSCDLYDYAKLHPEMKIAYLSNPPDKFLHTKPNRHIDEVDPTNLNCPLDYLDRTTMAKDVPLDWYLDDLHVLSILNEEYNHQLVEMICPLLEVL